MKPWQADELVIWLDNGYWGFLGASFKWPLLIFPCLTCWCLRWWRVEHVRRKWQAIVDEAEAKGLFGTARKP